MKIDYNVKGAGRKALAKAVAEYIGEDLEYAGMPTMNYTVIYYTITPNGVLEFADRTDTEEVEGLLIFLDERGFRPVSGKTEIEEKLTQENAKTPQRAAVGLTIEIPKEQVNIDNLNNLLKAKGTLIKKALGVENINVEQTGETVKFPWFDRELTKDETRAYTDFISAVCKMSAELKRISPENREAENEKYAFRCFLLRLGFIGVEYKSDRRILLRNFEGSSAFKSGVRKSPKINGLTVICSGQKESWDSREEAAAFYLEAMSGCEGSERERYTNIYTAIMSGAAVCTDEEQA